MKILVSGARGFVGSVLTHDAQRQGHTIVALTRTATSPTDIQWDPAKEQLETDSLNGFDAVIHLAGESIAEGRWNPAKKQRIRDSRVGGTKLLAEALCRLPADQRPKVLISASAIGYYGDRGDEVLTEKSAPGQLFLSEVCRQWELASSIVTDAGIRVVHPRLGVILHPDGGALAKMLLPFRLGLGGVIGSGQQYWSWITLQDVVDAILHCMGCGDLHGPVNIVSPQPATNRQFTQALGKAIHRPTILPMPAFAARLALGEMANELLLASARVAPTRLEATGYEFRHTDLDAALQTLLDS